MSFKICTCTRIQSISSISFSSSICIGENGMSVRAVDGDNRPKNDSGDIGEPIWKPIYTPSSGRGVICVSLLASYPLPASCSLSASISVVSHVSSGGWHATAHLNPFSSCCSSCPCHRQSHINHLCPPTSITTQTPPLSSTISQKHQNNTSIPTQLLAQNQFCNYNIFSHVKTMKRSFMSH